MKDKSALRKEYKLIRDSLSEDTEKLSREICFLCAETDAFKDARNVLLYYAKGSEVSLGQLFERAVSLGKSVGYPRCVDKSTMVFHKVESFAELKAGYFGIMEPSEDLPLCSLENAVCFVPGLAFDEDGYRLGYGGGYYDRFLSDFLGVTIGVTYEKTLADRLPRGEYDIKTDYIITESKVRKTSEN